MMVKCPDCNSDISSLANPCSKCGFPFAGLVSKQTAEIMRDKILQNPTDWNWAHGVCSKRRSRNFLGGTTYHEEHQMKIKSCIVSIFHGPLGWGYFPEVEVFCKACGERGPTYVYGIEILSPQD